MGKVKVPIGLRIKSSLKGIKKTFNRPSYVVLAFISGFFISGFVIWSLNLDLLKYILFESNLSFPDKAKIIWDVQTGIYTAYSSFQATGIIIFGLLFGINFSLILKAIRKNMSGKIPIKSGGTGMALAIISGGCIACGTYLLTPLITSIGATATVSIYELSNLLNWLSIILILYSIFKLGEVLNNTVNNV